MRRQARLAEEFAAALEGRGVASARRDPALAPLLALAEGLQSVPLAATADFRDTLRRRLVAVAGVATAPTTAPSPLERAKTWVDGWRVQKAIGALAASMAGVVALTGVSVAASRSLPGDALYGVKRTAEGVQVSLARNDVNRGKRHLQHAETRLHEVADVVGTDIALGPAPSGPGQITVAFGGSKSTRVSSALRAMDTETRDGTQLLFRAYTAERDDDVLRVVQGFTERQRARLGQVLDSLPTDAHDEAEASLALVSSLNLRATQLLSVGTDAPAPAPVALPTPDGTPVAVTPTATPSYDDLGPVPCTCPGDPTATAEPAPAPTPAPTPQPTPTPTQSSPTPEPPPSPSPGPTHYPIPSVVPSPVASSLQPIVDDVNGKLPTPLPTLPPVPAAPADQPADLPVAPRP
jgi:hypothetical protein